jgi:Glutamate racemase
MKTIFYLGDTARVPYGNKSAETVERYALELAKNVDRRKCETDCGRVQPVSSVAIPKLRANFRFR